MTISVLVVDDHAIFADAIQQRLAREPGLSPIEVAYSVSEGERRIRGTRVDVAVIDYVLADGRGTELAERIRTVSPETKVIILSGVKSVDPVVDALAAGARAWLPKSVDAAYLVTVIRGVHMGEMWLSPALLGEVLPRLVERVQAKAPDALSVLSQREREVLDCLVDGMTRAEIATRLGLSGNTVRTHTQNLTRKLGVHSALEAVVLALHTSGYEGGARRSAGGSR